MYSPCCFDAGWLGDKTAGADAGWVGNFLQPAGNTSLGRLGDVNTLPFSYCMTTTNTVVRNTKMVNSPIEITTCEKFHKYKSYYKFKRYGLKFNCPSWTVSIHLISVSWSLVSHVPENVKSAPMIYWSWGYWRGLNVPIRHIWFKYTMEIHPVCFTVLHMVLQLKTVATHIWDDKNDVNKSGCACEALFIF